MNDHTVTTAHLINEQYWCWKSMWPTSHRLERERGAKREGKRKKGKGRRGGRRGGKGDREEGE